MVPGLEDESARKAKEIRKILKAINADLKRLLDLTEGNGDDESVFVQCVRSGARSLRMARRIAKQKNDPS